MPAATRLLSTGKRGFLRRDSSMSPLSGSAPILCKSFATRARASVPLLSRAPPHPADRRAHYGTPRKKRKLPGLRVELPVAVGEHEDPLDVPSRFVEREVFQEGVEADPGTGLLPHPLDPVGAAVVAGEGELQVAVEVVEQLAQVGGTQAEADPGVVEVGGPVGQPE